MSSNAQSKDVGKFAAAQYVLNFIEDGMKIGLGTGSTVDYFIKLLSAHVQEKDLELQLVATSSRTEVKAQPLGLKLSNLNHLQTLDMAIDGADEINPELQLIKGGGGALLREKIVASSSDSFVVIADQSKLVKSLGKFPLPIEVEKFGWKATLLNILSILEQSKICEEFDLKIRQNKNNPFITDGGNFIIDLYAKKIFNPYELSLQLNLIPGVVETGLFLDMYPLVIVGNPDGTAYQYDPE